MPTNTRTLAELGLTDSQRERVLLGIHEGKYNLLLGAGASYGCVGGEDYVLKDAATVSQDICKAFTLKLNPDESKKLPISYETAKRHEAARLSAWINTRFTGCRSTWQKSLFRFPWERIWTFNIDDVLPHAFKQNTENFRTSIKEFDWKELVTPLDVTIGAQQIVYLHGRAADLGTAKDGLIFSIADYAAATKSQQQWHATFQTHYLEDPFIVCGASLTEEVDIAEAIRSKNQSNETTGFPSLIVSYSLDEGQLDRMIGYNLLPIVCPLDEFFEILQEEYREYRKAKGVAASQLPNGYFERFVAQFRRLEIADRSAAAIRGTDFYGGDEPIWMDILSQRDARLTTTTLASKYLHNSSRQFALLIHGHPVSGKTTTLLRIAHDASKAGFNPFWFRHEDGINAKVAAAYLAIDESAVLLIDDAADHTEAIGQILTICAQDKKPARIFMTARSHRKRGFLLDIPDKFRREIYQGTLRYDDLKSLVGKRRQASRLGKLVGRKDSAIVHELIRVCKSELLGSVSHIEFSEPLRQRVRKIMLPALSTPSDKELVSRIACVHRFGFPLPIRAALLSSGLSFSDFKYILDGQLSAEGPMVRDEKGVRLRHRILSQYAWTDCFDVDDRYTAMSGVVKALAPLVNPAVIRAKQIEHLIIRKVLDQEEVSQSIGPRALEFYEAHEDLLGWSSRYWDQRALLESKIEGHFSKAYSYSQKAISLEKHSFAYTSFGSICMTHALRIFDHDQINSMKYFREGEEALTTAWELAEKKGVLHEHPFVKFFASASHLARRMNARDTEFGILLQFYEIWLERARASKVFASAYGSARVQELQSTLMKQTMRIRAVGNGQELTE